jgi:hypothetical protein
MEIVKVFDRGGPAENAGRFPQLKSKTKTIALANSISAKTEVETTARHLAGEILVL